MFFFPVNVLVKWLCVFSTNVSWSLSDDGDQWNREKKWVTENKWASKAERKTWNKTIDDDDGEKKNRRCVVFSLFCCDLTSSRNVKWKECGEKNIFECFRAFWFSDFCLFWSFISSFSLLSECAKGNLRQYMNAYGWIVLANRREWHSENQWKIHTPRYYCAIYEYTPFYTVHIAFELDESNRINDLKKE